MMSLYRASLAALLLLPLIATAQSLQKPKEFYFDEDVATTRPIVVAKGSDQAAVDRLTRLIERKDRNADEASAQLAQIAFATDRVDTGKALYAGVLARTGGSGRLRNTLLWNYGWDLYRSGDASGALTQWSDSLATRTVNPAWVPPTFAMALWTLGRKDEAVRWYAAAVRTEPTRWRSAANFPGLLPDWTDAERATLAEVHAAWQAAPPAWP